MKKYNLNVTNFNWIEDSSFIGFSTYFIDGLSFLIVDIDTNIETKYESGMFVSYISPAKIVLKQYAHVDINIKTSFGKNSIQLDPFIIEKLEISKSDKDMLVYKFKLIGDGRLIVHAMEGCMYILEETISIKGQSLYVPTDIRNKFIAKFFRDSFFKR